MLAEGLAGWKPRARYRGLLRVGESPGNYAAVSEFPPSALAGLAGDARNKTILDLSLALVVVQSGESGGTWEAGLECLRLRKPLLVAQRQVPPETEGNAELIRRGGIAVSTMRQLAELLESIREGRSVGNREQLTLPEAV